MADEQVNIDLTAKDRASKVIEGVADDVEALEKAEPEVVITADDNASKVVEQVAGDVKALTRADHELKLTARVDTLRRELAKAEGELDAVREHAEDADRAVGKIGGEQRVGAIRDLTGPLGDVSTAVGDFGDSFVAAGEQIGTAMGLSEQAMGRFLGFLGPAGIAAGIGFHFWNTFKRQAQEARAEVAEVRASIEDIGVKAAAKQALTEALRVDPKLVDDVRTLGLGFNDLLDVVQGKVSPAFEDARARAELFNTVMSTEGVRIRSGYVAMAERVLNVTREEAEAFVESGLAAERLTGEVEDQTSTIGKARDEHAKFAAVLQTAAIPSTEEMAEMAKGAAGWVAGLNKELKGVPPETKGNVTVTADDRELDDAKGKVDALDGRRVQVTVDASPSDRLAAALTNATLPPGWGTRSAAPAASVTNVTIHAPRGMRPAELVRAGERYARRNGGGRARR